MYSYSSIGKNKVEVAAKKIEEINPFVNIEYFNLKINDNNINDLIDNYDIILDSLDNFESRYIVEKACCLKNKIVVHGSVSRFQGQVSVFTPESACYNCIFPNKLDMNDINSDEENLIFGSVTGIIGIIQAMECVKIILDIGDHLINKLLCYNALNQTINIIKIDKDPNCLVCGKGDIDNE